MSAPKRLAAVGPNNSPLAVPRGTSAIANDGAGRNGHQSGATSVTPPPAASTTPPSAADAVEAAVELQQRHPLSENLGSVGDKWQPAIHRAVKAVVSIHFYNVTPFDTERTYASEATGFVVDAERGIIMTNRHVVGPGPFRGYAVFDNHEECRVHAMYRDPVHDFGFLRFDPKEIKYMAVTALQLQPENARVGTEIRVIGNDAGEKLSILAGVISRVDRNAPDYGEMGYNDYNTEYIQAAASATGGSSGSPVVDVHGHVVALQAGGSTVASTDFFLPLFRGQRALRCLQEQKPITRGTIQVKWTIKPYDECRCLGLTPAAEAEARRNFPEAIGMLVAAVSLPGGPASVTSSEPDASESESSSETAVDTASEAADQVDDQAGDDASESMDVDDAMSEDSESDRAGSTDTASTITTGDTATSAGSAVEEGDCLLSVGGRPLAYFRDLDAILDASVGETLEVRVMRRGRVHTAQVTVQNLFDITPSRFVRVAGAVFHELSYQLASYYAHAVRGVYTAFTGFYFNPTNAEDYSGWVLVELDDRVTPDLDTFVEVVADIPNGKLVPAKFWHVADPHTILTSVVNVSRQWSGGPQDFELAQCNDVTGEWEFTPLGGRGRAAETPQRQAARITPLANADATPAIAALSRSFVRVRMLRPAMLEGFTVPAAQMHGFVVDARLGLVLVSMLAVPHYLVDITVEIADSVILPAKVVFVHPQQGWAVVRYDPELIDAPLEAIQLPPVRALPATNAAEAGKAGEAEATPVPASSESGFAPLAQGTPLKFVGYDTRGSAFVVDTKIADIAPVAVPIGFGVAPRYRTTNVESIGVDSTLVPELDAGLLADPATGVVRALWLSHLADTNVHTRRDRIFKFAIDAATVAPTVAAIRAAAAAGGVADPRFIDVEASPIKISTARIRKVPAEWLERVEAARPPAGGRRVELLAVSRVAAGLQRLVEEGDVIVDIDGVPATSVVQLTDLPGDPSQVELTVIRRGQEMRLTVPTTRCSDTVTTSLVSWAGMTVHRPHHAVLQQVKNPPSQVYIVSTHAGSPAAMFDLYATSFVTQVNGTPTPDIDTFYRVIKGLKDHEFANLRLVTFEGMPTAVSIRTDYHYFPTWRIDLDLKTGEWTHTS